MAYIGLEPKSSHTIKYSQPLELVLLHVIALHIKCLKSSYHTHLLNNYLTNYLIFSGLTQVLVWWWQIFGGANRCNNGAKRKEEVAVVMAARRSDATFVHGGEKIEVCCFCLLWSHMVEGDVEHGVDCCGGSVMIWRRWWREDEGSHYRWVLRRAWGGSMVEHNRCVEATMVVGVANWRWFCFVHYFASLVHFLAKKRCKVDRGWA